MLISRSGAVTIAIFSEPRSPARISRPAIQVFFAAKDLLRDQQGLFFLFAAVAVGLGILPVVGIPLTIGCLLCGFSRCVLQCGEGEEATWQGFAVAQRCIQSGLVATVLALVTVAYAVCVATGLTYLLHLLDVGRQADQPFWTNAFSLPILLLAEVYVVARLQAMYPLIAMYGISGWRAFWLSREATQVNLASALSLTVLQLGAVFAGTLTCIFPLIFIVPIVLACSTVWTCLAFEPSFLDEVFALQQPDDEEDQGDFDADESEPSDEPSSNDKSSGDERASEDSQP